MFLQGTDDKLQDLLYTDSLLRTFDIPKTQLYQIPLTGDASPTRVKKFYLQFMNDMKGKQIVGLTYNNVENQLSTYIDSGTTIFVPSIDQYNSFTISFWDIRTKSYRINRLPIGFLRPQSVANTTTNKRPFTLFDIMPDFEQSFIMFNGPAGAFVSTPYYLQLTVFYND